MAMNAILKAAALSLAIALSGCGNPAAVRDAEPSSQSLTAAHSAPTPVSSDPLPVFADYYEFDLPHQVSDPWRHIERAEVENRTQNLLAAANGYVTMGRIADARTVLGLLDETGLEARDSVSHALIQARMRQSESDHVATLEILAPLENSGLSLTQDQHYELLLMKASTLSQLGGQARLVATLVQLHAALPEGGEKTRFGHYIWTQLRQMSFEELSLMQGRLRDPLARQWIRLALATNLVLHDPQQFAEAVDVWAKDNFDHPAASLLSAGLLPDPFVSAASLRKIALVLPLTSANARAAHAFADGVFAQHEANTGPFKPELEAYDSGSEPELTATYYSQAIRDGANFVIGPLGVRPVNAMAQDGAFAVPTLVLGELHDADVPDHVYQFALAPESDGIDVARRARTVGHQYALVLYPNLRWARRAHDAFVEEFTRLNGTVINSLEYELDQPDYSGLIRQLLSIEFSERRHALIAKKAGKEVKFAPRRREDADVIFLLADPAHGRLIKPHIDFLEAHDLPVYSTWRIFAGNPDPANDSDLNGVRFADMNWLVEKSDAMNKLRNEIPTPWRRPSGLDRLFAMGVDSYNLVARVSLLSEFDEAQYHGITSTINAGERNHLLRSPVWAEFAEGVPRPLPNVFQQNYPLASRGLVKPAPAARRDTQ